MLMHMCVIDCHRRHVHVLAVSGAVLLSSYCRRTCLCGCSDEAAAGAQEAAGRDHGVAGAGRADRQPAQAAQGRRRRGLHLQHPRRRPLAGMTFALLFTSCRCRRIVCPLQTC